MNVSRRFDCEVIVVGAGPAGSAVAAHLAGLGHEVMVLEKATAPAPKVCGEYLSPDCARLLDRLGALDDLARHRPVRVRGMRIHTPRGSVVTGHFPETGTAIDGTAPARQELRDWRGGLAVSRSVLDPILARTAERRAADLRRGVRVSGLARDHRRVTGVIAEGAGPRREIRCRLVIGADGRHSVVTGSLGWRRPHRRLHRTGFIMRYSGVRFDSPYGEVLLGEDSYCILNPLGHGTVSVGLVLPFERARRRESDPGALVRRELQRFPMAADAIRGGALIDGIRGIGPLAFYTAAQAGDGVLLVGDAAGFLDPLTGEGIHIALRGAELAAEVAHDALGADSCSHDFLTRYESLRRRYLLPKRRFCSLLQSVIRHPRLLELLAGGLNRFPDLRTRFMGVIGDTLPPTDLIVPSLLRNRAA
jgi:flavin-dependent dehydrogenase